MNISAINGLNSSVNMQPLSPKSHNSIPAMSYADYKSVPANTLMAYNNVIKSNPLSFCGDILGFMPSTKLVACPHANGGEKIGSQFDINGLLAKIELAKSVADDGEGTAEVSLTDKDSAKVKVTQDGNSYLYNISTPKSHINVTVTPDTPEKAHILNTKGALMGVVKDGSDVILTSNGTVTKKGGDGVLMLDAAKDKPLSIPERHLVEKQASPEKVLSVAEIRERQASPDVEGASLVIGLENHRFVNGIIESIEQFQKDVLDGKIELPPFVPAKDVDTKGLEIAMLAGGFGSRSEYTNASSSGIFEGKENGAEATKGIFKTATGLTPMGTTFMTLHKAGLLDCSNLKLGKNIKFYLNQGANLGNGHFSIGLYNTVDPQGDKNLFILPNDSMSRLTKASMEATELVSNGKAAIAMIAKKVPAQSTVKTFGIIARDENNKITQFMEKPASYDLITPEYKDENDMCLTNTFQFTVSKEAFKALDMFNQYLDPSLKESGDWSKTLVPIIQSLTQNDTPEAAAEAIMKDAQGIKKDAVLDLGIVKEAQELLKGQEIMVVPTDEPWADCGQLDALYNTTWDIAEGKFGLEPFEVNNVLGCVDAETGLIASSPEQKAEILSKYDVNGRVMAVKEAPKSRPSAFIIRE